MGGVVQQCRDELRATINAVAPFEPVDSAEITPDHWKAIAKTIYQNYEQYDSFVVSHGTNTMAQSSMALGLILGNIGKPVILTGSQESFEKPNSDAPKNFKNAFTVAAHCNEQIRGPAVVFQDKIISGMRACKTSNTKHDAFSTFGDGQDIGKISGGTIQLNKNALDKHNANFGNASRREELDVRPDFDASGALQPYIVHAGFNQRSIMDDMKFKPYVKGFILSCSGDGDPNMKTMTESIEEMRNRRIPCIVTSHSTDGTSNMVLNEPGVNARKMGAIPSGELNPVVCSNYASWLIAQGCSYENFPQAMKANRNEVVRYLPPKQQLHTPQLPLTM